MVDEESGPFYYAMIGSDVTKQHNFLPLEEHFTNERNVFEHNNNFRTGDKPNLGFEGTIAFILGHFHASEIYYKLCSIQSQ